MQEFKEYRNSEQDHKGTSQNQKDFSAAFPVKWS